MNFAGAVLMSVSKGSGKLNYDLTSKLNASGFTKSLLELLKSYLTICWHKINSTKSISQEVLVII